MVCGFADFFFFFKKLSAPFVCLSLRVMPAYFSEAAGNGLWSARHLWPVWVFLLRNIHVLLGHDVQQGRKRDISFESSVNHSLKVLLPNWTQPSNLPPASWTSFLPTLTFYFLLSIELLVGELRLRSLFISHLARSRFQSDSLWKWHKLLFGLPQGSAPLLLLSREGLLSQLEQD